MQRLAKQLESKVYISAMIQPVPKSKKERKSISRHVNLAISSPPATTEYLQWSDQPVRFSRADHPRKFPRPGHAPMVQKAQIGGYDIGKVFMDAGSGINLIYARTLRAMCISLESLKPTGCSFHGIVPGSVNYPLGKIELDVCFSKQQLSQREAGVRSHGLAFTVSCNPRACSICKIHGSTPLRVYYAKDSRAQRNNHSLRQF
jgi:hypothetical protein